MRSHTPVYVTPYALTGMARSSVPPVVGGSSFGIDRKTSREIGVDVPNFAEALRRALRQDPDVILVGEMRDLETIETAILAAETGHLVMSTLHTLDAQETITRIISVFPEHQRDQARLIIASVLRGIVSQRLIPRADGLGMVPAVEVLIASARVKEYIADKTKTRDLHDVIAQGHTSYGRYAQIGREEPQHHERYQPKQAGPGKIDQEDQQTMWPDRARATTEAKASRTEREEEPVCNHDARQVRPGFRSHE